MLSLNKKLYPTAYKSAFIIGLSLATLPLQAAKKPLPEITHTADAKLKTLLLKSKGQLSPQLRQEFIKTQQSQVLNSLAEKGQKIDKGLLAWIKKDKELSDALFATVCPADPEILLNLNQLWKEQGPQFTKKYKHLSIAAAVARRGAGVGPMSHFGSWATVHKRAKLAIENGEDPYKALQVKKEKNNEPLTAEDKAAMKELVAYTKEHNITYRQALEEEEHDVKVRALIEANGSKINSPAMLKLLLLKEGKRPSKRSSFPSVAEFNKYLTKIIETPPSKLNLTSKQRWPIFPATTAPWPLMMPITHGIPLDEAQFIWEKFQGEHGEKRLHNYGPYRKALKHVIPELEPDTWHWGSYPSTIKTGGICGTMSKISMSAYTALGRPLQRALQPKHSCIVGYNLSAEGKYIAGVGQSVSAGPSGTTTDWLFRDGATWDCRNSHANATHHYGLALSMNLGLKSYMDSRITLHLYRHLSKKEQMTIGRDLLMNSLKKVPFNTETWFTLAQNSRGADELLSILNDIDTFIETSAKAEYVDTSGDVAATIKGAENEGQSKKSHASNVASYQRDISSIIIKNAFSEPTKFNKVDQKKVLQFLKTTRTKKDKELNLAYDRFRVAVHGSETIMAEIESHLNAVLNPVKNKKGKEKNSKKATGTLLKSFAQIELLIPDRQKRQVFLASLLEKFPKDNITSINKKDKTKLHPVYQAISISLEKSYLLEPKDKKSAKALKAERKALTKSKS